MQSVTIRPATSADAKAIWSILEPVLCAGETYTLPPDMPRDEALAYWFLTGHEVLVAEEDGVVLGTYYMRANQKGRRFSCGELRLYGVGFGHRSWCRTDYV